MAKLTLQELDTWIDHELYVQTVDLDNLRGSNIENIMENVLIRVLLLKSETMHQIFDRQALRTYICSYIYTKYNKVVKETQRIEIVQEKLKWWKQFFKTLKLKVGIA